MLKKNKYEQMSDQEISSLLNKNWYKLFLTTSYILITLTIEIICQIKGNVQGSVIAAAIVYLSAIYIIGIACTKYGEIAAIGITAVLVYASYRVNGLFDIISWVSFICTFGFIVFYFIYPLYEIIFIKKYINFYFKITPDFLLNGIILSYKQLAMNLINIIWSFAYGFFKIIILPLIYFFSS